MATPRRRIHGRHAEQIRRPRRASRQAAACALLDAQLLVRAHLRARDPRAGGARSRRPHPGGAGRGQGPGARPRRPPGAQAAGERRPVKILFLGRHYTYFRNFESVLRPRAARGQSIHLAVERSETLGGLTMVEALAAEFPAITYGETPARADDDWSWVLNRLRMGLDYRRYQQPVFDSAYTLRSRARGRTPGAFVGLGEVIRRTGGWSRRLVSAIVRNVERAVPDDPTIREYLEARTPDIVLLTPLIDLGSAQIEYLRAGRPRGIPTGLCVWSWDHLSSKAFIRDAPDRVFVWNPTQKQEAMQLHGVAASRIVVTGAQCFDQWFDRQPSRDRETFCRQVGLPSSPPFVLWVCSALFHGSPVVAP